MNNDQLALLRQWDNAKRVLDEAKAHEGALRKQVVEEFSEAEPDYSGVENHDIGDGFDLKINHSLTYSVDDETVDAALDELRALGNEGTFVADRIVKFKPSLSLSEYKTLTPEQKAIVDKVLTAKPGSKSIEIKERKR